MAIFEKAPETQARARDIERKLATWYEGAGRHADFAQLLRRMADAPETLPAERTALLCRVADAQVRLTHQIAITWHDMHQMRATSLARLSIDTIVKVQTQRTILLCCISSTAMIEAICMCVQEGLLPDVAEEHAATLREIVEAAPPSVQFVRYHDALLQHQLAATTPG